MAYPSITDGSNINLINRKQTMLLSKMGNYKIMNKLTILGILICVGLAMVLNL